MAPSDEAGTSSHGTTEQETTKAGGRRHRPRDLVARGALTVASPELTADQAAALEIGGADRLAPREQRWRVVGGGRGARAGLGGGRRDSRRLADWEGGESGRRPRWPTDGAEESRVVAAVVLFRGLAYAGPILLGAVALLVWRFRGRGPEARRDAGPAFAAILMIVVIAIGVFVIWGADAGRRGPRRVGRSLPWATRRRRPARQTAPPDASG